MKVSAEFAVEHFDDIASAVDRGEIVEIARLHKPALQLVRSSALELPQPVGERVLGAGTAFTHPPSEEELERIDREWKREIEAGKTFEASSNATKRVLGAGVGEIRVPSDEEWERMDKEWRKSFAEKFDLED